MPDDIYSHITIWIWYWYIAQPYVNPTRLVVSVNRNTNNNMQILLATGLAIGICMTNLSSGSLTDDGTWGKWGSSASGGPEHPGKQAQAGNHHFKPQKKQSTLAALQWSCYEAFIQWVTPAKQSDSWSSRRSKCALKARKMHLGQCMNLLLSDLQVTREQANRPP